MEKFRDWVDPGSGLNPWPPLYKKNPNTFFRIINILLGPFLSLARMLVFVALYLLAFLLSIVLTPLAFIPVLGRLFVRFFDVVLSRAMLLILGVFWINTQDYSKQANRNRTAASKKQAAPVAAGGDLIVCNYTSYTDVLYLVYSYSPIFAMFPDAGDNADSKEFMVKPCGFVGALMSSFSHGFPVATESLADTIARGKSRGQPIIVFGEGVRTNGICVISMQPFTKGIKDLKSSVFLIGFKHEQHLGCPPFTAGASFWHLFHLGRQLFTRFTVRYMDSRCVPEAEEPEIFAATCRDLIARWTGLKPVKSKTEEKAEFLKFYDTGVKQRKTRVGQGGRVIAGETGLKPQKVDHAVLREERLRAKKQAIKDDEAREDAEWEDDDVGNISD